MTLIKRTQNNYPSFPSFFENWFNNSLMDLNDYSHSSGSLPAINVKEDNDKYEVEVAAPGMEKDDFNLKLENDILTISAEKRDEKNEDNDTYSRKEFSYQSFKRSFTLPDGHIMTDKIEAKYTNGILKIQLPKREEVKPQPPKEISIS